VVSVAAANKHSAAVTSAGEVWTWGGNAAAQLGYGTSDSGCNPTPRLVETLRGRQLVKVAAAKHHTGKTLSIWHSKLPGLSYEHVCIVLDYRVCMFWWCGSWVVHVVWCMHVWNLKGQAACHAGCRTLRRKGVGRG
jgi:hypothetical protein